MTEEINQLIYFLEGESITYVRFAVFRDGEDLYDAEDFYTVEYIGGKEEKGTENLPDEISDCIDTLRSTFQQDGTGLFEFFVERRTLTHLANCTWSDGKMNMEWLSPIEERILA